MEKTNREKRLLTPVVHSLAWAAVIFIPVVIFYSEGKPLEEIIHRVSKQLFWFMLLFYVNYYYGIDRLLFKRKFFRFLLFNLGCVAIILYIKHGLPMPAPPPPNGVRPPRQGFIYFDFLINLLPILSAIAIKYAQQLYKLELNKKEIEAAKLDAELQHLKYQIQPHFFFNSLNNIYSLIAFDQDKAQKSVHSLSKLMRHFLQKSNQPQILLAEEIDFLNQYVELMRLRLTERTEVTVLFPTQIPQVHIAPLLLITLVENAFKHGVSATKSSFIRFELTASEQEIRFVSENTLFDTLCKDLYSSSIGIANLRKQLNLLYPEKNNYTISTEGGTYRAELIIYLQ